MRRIDRCSPLALLALCLMCSTPAVAIPSAPAVVCEMWPDIDACRGRVPQCSLCHTSTSGPVAWNDFGLKFFGTDTSECAAGNNRWACFRSCFDNHLRAALDAMAAEPGDTDADCVDDITELLYGTDHLDEADHPWAPFELPAPVGEPNATYAVGEWDARFAYRRIKATFCGLSPDYDEMGAFDAKSDAEQLTAVHEASSRGGGPFTVLDLGGIPEEEVRSVLLNEHGPLRRSHGGTLYVEGLEEVEEAGQAVLFDLFQTGGLIDEDDMTHAIDVRPLLGAGRELEFAVSEGHLRPEFSELVTMSLHVPPLRHRREDIAPLFLHFLRQALRDHGDVTVLHESGPGRPLWLPPDFMGRLLRHQWPGNCDQLEAVAREVAATCKEGYTLRVTGDVERYLDNPD
ncbi:MAG: hypothetical protein QF464_19310, partial [Myxococcota bacterium]|nr:hypothetical protein [Myxococcota bacterium]